MSGHDAAQRKVLLAKKQRDRRRKGPLNSLRRQMGRTRNSYFRQELHLRRLSDHRPVRRAIFQGELSLNRGMYFPISSLCCCTMHSDIHTRLRISFVFHPTFKEKERKRGGGRGGAQQRNKTQETRVSLHNESSSLLCIRKAPMHT